MGGISCILDSSGAEGAANPTIPNPMASDPFSIDSLAAELIKEHAKLAKATEHFERLKGDFLAKCQAENIGAVKVKSGTVTVCTRTGKDYGHTVKVLEASLKAEKARLDHLLEFTIKSVTHYLRIN